MASKPPEGTFERPLQLVRRAFDGPIQGRRLVAYRNRLTSRQAGFYEASFVVAVGLGTIYIAEMDLHASDLIAEPAQCALHGGFDLTAQLRIAIDVPVGIDLDLHDGCLR
jgi:hypothetical protein